MIFRLILLSSLYFAPFAYNGSFYVFVQNNRHSKLNNLAILRFRITLQQKLIIIIKIGSSGNNNILCDKRCAAHFSFFFDFNFFAHSGIYNLRKKIFSCHKNVKQPVLIPSICAANFFIMWILAKDYYYYYYEIRRNRKILFSDSAQSDYITGYNHFRSMRVCIWH